MTWIQVHNIHTGRSELIDSITIMKVVDNGDNRLVVFDYVATRDGEEISTRSMVVSDSLNHLQKQINEQCTLFDLDKCMADPRFEGFRRDYD